MESFSGRLFGPGLPGTGAEVRATWQADGSLLLQHAGEQWYARQLQVESGGFNAATLRLTWQAPDGAFAFCLDDGQSISRCRAAAPAQLAAQLTAATVTRRRVERRFRLGWAALAALLALPLLLLGVLLFQSDRLADWAIERIPPREDARLGELVLAQTRLSSTLSESGPAVAALRVIGAPLTAGSPYQYRWFVAHDPAINAFAAPGGIIVVNSGLLRAVATPEELAGVLAHEIAHAELRHSLKALVKSLGLRALATVVLGDLSGSTVTEAAQRLTELGYSRAAERETDREAIRRLAAARIDPHGLLDFFTTLERQETITPPAFLSTHPETAERLADLRQALAGLDATWTPLPVDLAAVQAALPQP